MTKTLERPPQHVRRVRTFPVEPRQPLGRRHARAKRTMIGVAIVCALIGATPGVQQLVVRGWRTFISRPAGVGASEDGAADGGDSRGARAQAAPDVAPAPTPAPGVAAPPPAAVAPAPVPRPVPRHRYGRDLRHRRRAGRRERPLRPLLL